MTKQFSVADQAQRQLALDPQKSFIVQAPAGSGKTELLIQRLLVLLARVNVPQEVLAITFTKKAANEMRERVINALKEASNTPEPEAAHKRHTWRLAKKVLEQDEKLQWHLLSNPNQLRIQTIDSLCAFLTRQLPLLSHFGSQPDIADMPEYLYKKLLTKCYCILKKIPNGQSLLQSYYYILTMI
jgi:ATP-dependent exoDNAse (exonuclease V) beta subunit